MDSTHKTHKWLITLTVMTGTLMATIDTSIVNVALPSMRGTLGASVEEITWVSTGYMLSSVIVMPLVALLSSRVGRKQFCIFSVLLFTCASMLCGIAWDLTSMAAFRVIQGFGGGALMPISQAVLRESFSHEEQGTAMGIFGLGTILGPALGPTIGGWITDNYSWPWIFYINVPMGILTTLLVIRFIHDPPYLERETGRLDFEGLFFMAVGLGALQIMLERGNQKDWFASDQICYLAAVAGLGLALFVWRELAMEKPAVNLRILKDTGFSSACFLGGIMGMGLFGGLFLMPVFLQQLLGYPAYNSGLVVLPRGLAMAISMPLAGRLYNKVGPKPMISIGLVMIAFSFYQLSRLSLDVGYWDLFLPQFSQGIGFGCVFVSLSTAGLSTIEKRVMTAASGLYNVTRTVFGSIGIALAATLLTRGQNWNRAIITGHIDVFHDATSESLKQLTSVLSWQGFDPALAGQGALKMMDGIVERQAGMLAFNHVFFLIAVLFLFSILLVVMVRDTQRASAEIEVIPD